MVRLAELVVQRHVRVPDGRHLVGDQAVLGRVGVVGRGGRKGIALLVDVGLVAAAADEAFLQEDGERSRLIGQAEGARPVRRPARAGREGAADHTGAGGDGGRAADNGVQPPDVVDQGVAGQGAVDAAEEPVHRRPVGDVEVDAFGAGRPDIQELVVHRQDRPDPEGPEGGGVGVAGDLAAEVRRAGEALVDDDLAAKLGDRVAEGDLVVVHRGAEPGHKSGLQHHADGPGVALFRQQGGVAEVPGDRPDVVLVAAEGIQHRRVGL